MMAMQRQLNGTMWPAYENVAGGSDSILDKSIYKNKMQQPNILLYCANDHKAILRLLYTVDKLYDANKPKSPILARFSPKQKSASKTDLKRKAAEFNTQLITLLNMIDAHLHVCCTVLKPAVSKYVSERNGGPKWAEAICKERATMLEQITTLRANTDDIKLFKKLFERVERHCSDCEHITLDWLFRCMNLQQLSELGVQYSLTKQDYGQPSSPTRLGVSGVPGGSAFTLR